MFSLRKILVVAVAVALASAFALPAAAQSLIAHLEGAQEVPPNASPATGLACLRLDAASGMLHYEIIFSGLLAPQTAIHIHGLAPRGVNAGVIFPLPNGSPIFGSVGPLSDAQKAGLLAGRMYVNVHTTLYPGGEIRGQIDEPGSCTVPIDPTTWGAIKALYQ